MNFHAELFLKTCSGGRVVPPSAPAKNYAGAIVSAPPICTGYNVLGPLEMHWYVSSPIEQYTFYRKSMYVFCSYLHLRIYQCVCVRNA